jgi:protein-export membrane protein SecD
LGLIFLFMAIYYKWSGMLANAALILNLFFLLAAMAMFHATLTLPGIAGIILTIGMAVDANVLILERIREEVRMGKTPRLAVDQGYAKAFSAIFDGNLTTIIAAVFLFQFGTGPVKGFGISLYAGFAGVYVYRHRGDPHGLRAVDDEKSSPKAERLMELFKTPTLTTSNITRSFLACRPCLAC